MRASREAAFDRPVAAPDDPLRRPRKARVQVGGSPVARLLADAPRRVQLRLESRGLLLLTTSFSFLIAGLLAERPLVMGWGAILLAALAFAWARVVLQGAASAVSVQVRCGALEGERKVHLVEDELTLPVTLTNGLGRPAVLLHVELVASSAVEVGPTPPISDPLEHGRETTLRLPLQAHEAGTWFIHGARVRLAPMPGLVSVTSFVPLDLSFKVLPRHAFRSPRAALALRSRSKRSSARDSLSGALSRTRGFGTDVRELREHLPGDPFRHIEWKATARTGKLIVKEFERDVTQTAYLLVDTGPSMRWGARGRTPLDRATELAFSLAQELARRGTRFGTATYDAEVWSLTHAADGRRNLFAVTDQLLEAHAVVREQVTAVTDEELVARVGEYALTQWGRDFSARGFPELDGLAARRRLPGALWDEDALIAWVGDLVARDPALGATAWLHRDTRLATDRRMSDLRMLCRLRGIELPVRSESPDGDRDQGLLDALRRMLRAPAGPHTVLVLTDLVGLEAVEQIGRAVAALTRRKSEVTFLVLAHEKDEATRPAGDPLEDALRDVFRRALTADHARLLAHLRKAGARLVPV